MDSWCVKTPLGNRLVLWRVSTKPPSPLRAASSCQSQYVIEHQHPAVRGHGRTIAIIPRLLIFIVPANTHHLAQTPGSSPRPFFRAHSLATGASWPWQSLCHRSSAWRP
ncbi:hypothetical protein B0I35DRAFT_422678 [Stachybotrys elegans]|uniref:Uncharacterized protein n=1 Tax=Stachybotrys elegans TaxID=80388 RepID=A0A8K0T1X1_9HYPO|nr:hypothetical protein B0I35DRAFT_422678 [Stachybotrys elegans]